MVSVLPYALQRRSRYTRMAAKALVVFAVLICVLFVYSASLQRERKTAHIVVNGFDDLYYTVLDTNVTDPENNETDADGCAVMNVPIEYRCQYIQNTSACENVYIKLQWCDFINVQWLYYILMILYILVLFFVLGDTAEAYFSPALIKISDYLRFD
jgi:hypothetical protein